jgi:predicted GNAT family N-acyltransferase
MSPKENGAIKMRQVAVSEQYQSKGLGSVLVKESEVFCKDKGFEKIVLNARDTAVKFYKRLDYTPEGELFTEVGIAHLKMYKSL